MLLRLAIYWYGLHKIIKCLQHRSYMGWLAGLLNESDVIANGQHLRISRCSECTLMSFYSRMVCEHPLALFIFNFVNYTQHQGNSLVLCSILRWLHHLTSFPKCYLEFFSFSTISKTYPLGEMPLLLSLLVHNCPLPGLQWQRPDSFPEFSNLYENFITSPAQNFLLALKYP